MLGCSGSHREHPFGAAVLAFDDKAFAFAFPYSKYIRNLLNIILKHP